MPKRKDATAISLQKTMTLGYKGKPGRRKNELILFNDFEMVKGGKENLSSLMLKINMLKLPSPGLGKLLVRKYISLLFNIL